ncbi:hypothetical protein [Flavobacterium psychrophilum]|uniref:Uncharacterized protein n=1 Tax=Flavobacterium psychrophilum TaxID=96345 RepID=A0A7U2R8Z9_FLAPS|nr:hypothetical protein [Flavobacterium psychrophilum]QRE03485.1 hypothetical protein H0H26_11430 [Flavobacterium psychrophilum]
MKTFEQYEVLALESKKILFDAYAKEQVLESEYQKKGGIHAGIEVYKWRNSEVEKIENEFKNNSHRALFLKAWNNGDFSICDYHLDRF